MHPEVCPLHTQLGDCRSHRVELRGLSSSWGHLPLLWGGEETPGGAGKRGADGGLPLPTCSVCSLPPGPEEISYLLELLRLPLLHCQRTRGLGSPETTARKMAFLPVAGEGVWEIDKLRVAGRGYLRRAEFVLSLLF